MLKRIVGITVLLFSGGSLALEPLSDVNLAGISGKDGLTVNLDAQDVDLSGFTYTIDKNESPAGLALEGISIDAVNNDGSIVGGDSPLYMQTSIDADGGAQPGLALSTNLQMPRARFRFESQRHLSEPGYSYGTWVLDSPIDLSFSTPAGVFNSAANNASLKLGIGNPEDQLAPGANFFYRQLWHQHPYMIFRDLKFLWDMPSLSFGIADETSSYGAGESYTVPAIQLIGDTNFKLNFDWAYRFPLHGGAQEFVVDGSEQSILNFGWQGGLKDLGLSIRSGGAWKKSSLTGSPVVFDQSAKTGGFNVGLKWNYYTSSDETTQFPNFRWNIGEATGDRVRLEFADWVNLPGAAYGFDFPLIAFDAINAGEGPGGVCWGGALTGPATAGGACAASDLSYIDLVAGDIANFDPAAPRTDASAIAMIVRNGNLLSYSNSVRILDDASLNRSFGWALIYTLANVNGNIYLYPGGNPSDPGNNSENFGMIADVLIATQSFDESGAIQDWRQGFNYAKGSHFLIGDTNPSVNKGIGFLSSSALLALNDLRIHVRPNWTAGDLAEAGLDLFTHDGRINFRGTFGGINLDGTNPVEGFRLDMNLEGLFNLRLSPANGPLGFSLATRLGSASSAITSGQGSYLSIEEPSRPGVTLTAGDITGDIALVDGTMDLQSDTETGDRPQLVISSEVQLGHAAIDRIRSIDSTTSSYASQPLKINSFQFSGERLGSIVVNSSTMNASLTLKPQTP